MTKVAIVEDNATLAKVSDGIDWRDTGAQMRVRLCVRRRGAGWKFPEHRPNVVLMDIHLPGESGIACTARLARKNARPASHHADRLQGHQNDLPGAQGRRMWLRFESVRTKDEILDAIAEVRAGGAPMTSEIARMVVRSFMEPAPAPLAEKEQLSSREMEILALLAEGLSNKEIGTRLQISFAHSPDAPDAYLRKTACPLPHRSRRQISSFESTQRRQKSFRELRRDAVFLRLFRAVEEIFAAIAG